MQTRSQTQFDYNTITFSTEDPGWQHFVFLAASSVSDHLNRKVKWLLLVYQIYVGYMQVLTYFHILKTDFNYVVTRYSMLF